MATDRGVALPVRQEQSTDALDVARLVESAADGDGQAWERLVDRYATLISAILEDFELGESTAAELAQMTRLRPLEPIHRQEEGPGPDAMSCLPERWRQMLEMLMADPPASYTEISDQLGFPVGSIGPTRQRCFTRLRQLLYADGSEPLAPGGNARARSCSG